MALYNILPWLQLFHHPFELNLYPKVVVRLELNHFLDVWQDAKEEDHHRTPSLTHDYPANVEENEEACKVKEAVDVPSWNGRQSQHHEPHQRPQRDHPCHQKGRMSWRSPGSLAKVSASTSPDYTNISEIWDDLQDIQRSRWLTFFYHVTFLSLWCHGNQNILKLTWRVEFSCISLPFRWSSV